MRIDVLNTKVVFLLYFYSVKSYWQKKLLHTGIHRYSEFLIFWPLKAPLNINLVSRHLHRADKYPGVPPTQQISCF